jgi:hypothetical protein
MIGAIKIKDGLFIGDEFAAQVGPSLSLFFINIHAFNIHLYFIGSRIRHGK